MVDGKIYSIGGVAADGDSDANEVYDPTTDTWKTLSPMATARDHLAAAAVDGQIYVMGGGLGSYSLNLWAKEAYDPSWIFGSQESTYSF